ncbi:TPA: DNA-methyltransferase [Aeromonas hydrophila]
MSDQAINNAFYDLHQGDAIEWLKSLNDSSVDLLITDPPYESLEKHRKVGTTTRLKQSKSSSNMWFEIFPNSRFETLFYEAYRVLRKNSHFYLFCDQETAFIVKPIAEAAGFKFWKPIVWDKMRIGMGYHYRAKYEFILFFEKGKRKLNNLSIPDILSVPRIHRGYPTEKPVELMKILISQSSNENELVCDPFMGACAVGVAAQMLNRKFIGNDLSSEALKLSVERLQKGFPDGVESIS